MSSGNIKSMEKLLKDKKDNALEFLRLTQQISIKCNEEEPDAELIANLFDERQSIIERIDELDGQLKSFDNLNEQLVGEIKGIFQKAGAYDDQIKEKLLSRFNEYKDNLNSINNFVKLTNVYNKKDDSSSGVFIDTKE